MSYLQEGRFAFVAHRGGSDEGPENTIEAFENTLRINPHSYFELDIRETKDKQIVVFHDPTIERVTNGTGKISNLTYAELLKFDVVKGSQKAKIPLLRNVLNRFPTSRISVELKESGYEEAAIKIIHECNAQDRVVLASFSKKALSNARRLAPGLCSGFASTEVPLMLLAANMGLSLLAPKKGNVFQIPLEKNGVAVYSKRFLQLAHKLKKHVHIWTINDEATMRRLVLDGVDGIITDSPRVLYKVLRELNKI